MRPLITIIDSIDNIHKANSRPVDNHYDICNASAKITELVLLVTMTAYIITISLLIIFGIVDAFLLGHRLPLAQHYLPYVYVYDDWLFAVLTLYNICILFVHVISTMPPDSLLFVVTANAPIAPAIVQWHMHTLSAKLRVSRVKHCGEVIRMLAEYITMHQKFNA